ncbi:aldehyde dehydrogenase family protein [Gammaproteobacteria bacterium AB-CW1]|uniref:Aldehyde dehydrogenase family protein n=1 Tax=Natronospira elongata TaxID=3110268 RepID=A0AAP6JDC8_9GAMM|nr:aldehyde dehydrogenase family protein [Gammaproteobacteria bacterium AB-CW1]
MSNTRHNPAEGEHEALVHNPATGELLSRHAWMSDAAVDEAFNRAREAQEIWAALPLRERARRIRPLAWWLDENSEAVATTISSCTGKPRQDAITTEILPAALATGYYCRMAPRWLRPMRPPLSTLAYVGKRTRVEYLPHGLVGIISPWNYPLGIPSHEIICALLAGNGVVFKTAPETIPVGECLAEGLANLDLPPGLMQHLVLPGVRAGERLLAADNGVDKLAFTGSVPVGRLLAARAGERLIPAGFELGGKDPMLVCHDAPMPRAVNGALWASIQNAGQACAGVERIYVDRRLHDSFVNELAQRVEGLRVGLPDGNQTDIGPLTTARQRDKVAEQVDQAVSAGAQIVAQAPMPQELPQGGYWYPPTLLSNVDETMVIMREETFGPVIAVQAVNDMDEAVALANQSPYALTASVWTRSRRRGRKLARRLNAGTVTVNDHLMTHGMPEISWGGPRHSGLGRSHGRSGMLAMARERNLVDERFHFLPRTPWWFPYSERGLRGLKGAISAFNGRGLGRRMRGLLPFLRTLPDTFRKQ